MYSPTIPRLFLALALFAALPARAAAPDPVGTLIDQANAAQAKGQTELALRLAQSAIVADPRRTASYVALGDIYAQAGQGEYARNYYEEALTIDPVDPSALKAIAALEQKPRVTASP